MEPARTENGYRDYSDEDMETLKKIMLLRALQVSLKDIRALQRGEDALGEVMQRRIDAMTQQRGELDRALRVCRELR
ncbi:MAG: MerR family transcriptional regulator [Oscillospiraceae bacterium]|nr:MerR family transcriptional regulator [Oscillospiraceae bacterium]